MTLSAEIPQWEAGNNKISGEEVFKDSAGNWPSKLNTMVEKTFYHPKTRHLYQIVGLGFDSERERWVFLYQRVGRGGLRTGPLFSHLPEDFMREGRFLEVDK